METEVNSGDLGNIRFKKSRRAKSLSIRVAPFSGVLVTVPSRCAFGRAEQFVMGKHAWIMKQLQHVRILEHNTLQRIELVQDMSEAAAKNLLKSRLRELSGIFEYPFNRVFVRHQKTRWGSCSGKNNINLNISLIILPDALRDYILLHELVHIRHKHHGPSFHAELDSIAGNSRHLKRQLRQYAIPPDNFLSA